jgi:SAM-dependent methyltransferase
MERRDTYEVIQGFYLGHALLALHEHGVLRSLQERQSVGALSRKFGLDAELLSHLLAFLHRSTNLLSRDRRGLYRLDARHADYASISFQIDKLLKAYGPPFASLASVLRTPSLGEKLIDQEALAKAFGSLAQPEQPSPGAQIITSMGVRTLIDLGCGPGMLLVELSKQDEGFRGWGLDRSKAMCRAARARSSSNGVSGRVKIIHGDARYLSRYFTPRRRSSVDALYAGSLLNEWFSDGEERVVAFLEEVRSLFPGRVLVVADYYGRLNDKKASAETYRHNLVHDIMQAVTGQGVPPVDLRAWQSSYRAAGCTMLHAYEGVADGLSWFYHIVRL